MVWGTDSSRTDRISRGARTNRIRRAAAVIPKWFGCTASPRTSGETAFTRAFPGARRAVPLQILCVPVGNAFAVASLW
jgi:hypothetical protein